MTIEAVDRKDLAERIRQRIRTRKFHGADSLMLYELLGSLNACCSSEIVLLLCEMREKGWISWQGVLAAHDQSMHALVRIDITKFPEDGCARAK